MNRVNLLLLPVLLLLAAGLAGCQEQGGSSAPDSSPTTATAPSSVAANTNAPTNAPAEAATSQKGNAPAEAAKGAEEAKGSSRGGAHPHVLIKTSMGTIEAELYPDKAPISVKNFLDYAKAGHYNGTIFHRVIKGFMIQGGGFTPDMDEKPTNPPIKNEGGNGLKNDRGTLAMARTSEPDSATAQFFISTVDNAFLNRDSAPDGVGYAVFGKVVKGMNVVDKIEESETATKETPHGPMENVPVKPVLIESITVK